VAHDQAAWLDRLDLELDNLRAAIAFSLTQPDPVPGIRLITGLRLFWKARGHATEAVEALRVHLDRPAARGPTLLRAQGLATAAYLLEQTGGYALAEEYSREALAMARAAGDDYLVADLLHTCSFVLMRRGRQAAALPLIEEGLARRVPMQAGIAYALVGLAMAGHGAADWGWSARLHGAADEALAVLGETIDSLEGQLRDLDCQRLRSAMGAAAFAAEYATGRALTSAEVVTLALGHQA
jgi:hypothetical protein